jgi:hypothetical protein
MERTALTSQGGVPAKSGQDYREREVHGDDDGGPDKVLRHEPLVLLLQEVMARIFLITNRITANH